MLSSCIADSDNTPFIIGTIGGNIHEQHSESSIFGSDIRQVILNTKSLAGKW